MLILKKNRETDAEDEHEDEDDKSGSDFSDRVLLRLRQYGDYGHGARRSRRINDLKHKLHGKPSPPAFFTLKRREAALRSRQIHITHVTLFCESP
jgi:hypothetical protein